MVLAADYPFMDVLWTMIIFFAWVCWIMLLFRIFGDLFRRRDTSGWGKAAWVIVMILLPFLGTLIYLIVNGRSMGDRDVEQARAAQAEFEGYVQSVATKQGAAGEIDRAKQLLDDGVIDQSEYARLKQKALA